MTRNTISAATRMTESLERAHRVLKLVRVVRTDKHSSNVSVYPFRNGREHGYVIQLWDLNDAKPTWWMFAELRNGDSMVLYEGKGFVENVPSDEVYAKAKHFGSARLTYRQVEEQLAQYITKAIRTAQKKSK